MLINMVPAQMLLMKDIKRQQQAAEENSHANMCAVVEEQPEVGWPEPGKPVPGSFFAVSVFIAAVYWLWAYYWLTR